VRLLKPFLADAPDGSAHSCPADPPAAEAALGRGDEALSGDPLEHEVSGRRRLRAGTLEYEIERARRHDRPLSVLAIVPDDLESLAAEAGDSLPRLLDVIDGTIEHAVRAIDTVERIGRSRFRVALPGTEPEAGRIVAERIRLQIDATRPEIEPGLVVGVSVSIGISTYPAEGTEVVELEAAAERALARAQELGGNRTVLFSVPAGAPPGWGLRSPLTSAAGTTPPRPQR
jgi:diguanylate cyclase (GGDEF)-like protein